MDHARSAMLYTGSAAAVLLAAAPLTALAQFAEPEVSVLYTLTTNEPGHGFGWAAEAIGDLDGDGASEIIVGAPRNNIAGPFAGAAFVYSGRDGTLINAVTGSPFDQIGFGVIGVDADGVPDYATSGPGTVGGPPPQLGRLLVISGATHGTLIDRSGPALGGGFGYDVGAAGDVNRDGHTDVIVGAPFHSAGLPQSGSVHLISGRDGTTIRSHGGLAAFSRFGSAVSGVADQDGDGRDDYAVGAFGGGAKSTGEAYVLSGNDGSLVRVLKAKQNTGVFFGNFFGCGGRGR